MDIVIGFILGSSITFFLMKRREKRTIDKIKRDLNHLKIALSLDHEDFKLKEELGDNYQQYQFFLD